MTGREKPKRKALHRGLDDIVNRDASLTSKLLGRVKPPVREPLEVQPSGQETPAVGPTLDQEAVTRHASESAPPPVKLRPRTPVEQAEVRLLNEARAEVGTTLIIPEADMAGTGATAPKQASVPFDEFVARWGFVLRSGGRTGKLRICQVLYDNTYAAGRNTFFTSYEKLAKLTGLEKKQCAINVKQLEGLGFIERLNIYNTATKQGTEFKLHLERLPPQGRKAPRHHYYDEDLPR